MPRPLHFIPPDSCVEVTSRTIQGRLLLKPSHELNRLILGVIGRAMTLYPIQLFIVVVLSNHLHLILQTPEGQTLARFMNYINSNIAREAGRLHAWKEKLWGRRYKKIPILDDESLLARFRYLLSHGCKEGLVKRPAEWPGVHCVNALLKGEKLYGIWVDRTQQYRAKLKGLTLPKKEYQTIYEVPLTPLPCWAELSEQERRRRTAEFVADIEAEARNKHGKAGRQVLGLRKIMHEHPHDQPHRSSKSPAPLCHASTQEKRRLFYQAYRKFVAQFRKAASLWRETYAVDYFPEHCFLPSGQYYQRTLTAAPS